MTAKQHAAVSNMLGTASRQAAAGQFAQAQMLCEQAIKQAPDFADAYFVLGTIHDAARRTGDAISAYRQAVKLHPEYRDAYVNLGISLRDEGIHEDALKAFEKALDLDPSFLPALTSLGTVLANLKRYNEALDVYRKALEKNQESAPVLRAMADSLSKTGRHREAVTYLEQALTFRPNWHPALMELASLLQKLGEFPRASAILIDIIDRGTNDGYAYYGLANIRDSKIDAESMLSKIDEALKRVGQKPDDQTTLYFAAGKMAERLGKPSLAFERYQEGNRIFFKRFDYNRKSISSWFDTLLEIYTPDIIAEKAKFSKSDASPIFIVGMPRSGTTLVEQIISSHPEVYGAGESGQLGRIVKRLSNEPLEGPAYPDCVPVFTADDLARHGTDYLGAVIPEGQELKRVSDKTPQNFMRLGFAHMLFPDARFIHCCRDPRDTCLSNFFSLYDGIDQSFSYDLPTIGFYYRHYHRLMQHWHKVLPVPIFDIGYEKLVADPEPQIRALLDFCGLEWNDACLNFHKTERVIETASVWQVRQPMYKSSAGKWRKYEKHLGPLKEALGDLWTD